VQHLIGGFHHQKDELQEASEERARMAQLLSDLEAASDPIKEREVTSLYIRHSVNIQ
jgi:hypothetical protein